MKVLAILLLAAIVRVVIARLSRRGGSQMADKDAQVLAQMKTHGSDLTKLHNIEFFLYLPTEDAANKAAAQIQVLGFETEVSPPPQGYTTWGCKATKSMVPELSAIKEIAVNLTRIASSIGGEYDGWGTPIVK